MKYSVNFQYMAKDDARPRDDGAFLDFPTDAKRTEDVELSFLPNVGDYVSLSDTKDDSADYSGVVKTKLFRYIKSDNKEWCQINIVVAESDFDFGLLIKE